MGESNSYVYRHIKPGTNEVFYIGIGSSKNFKRAYEKGKRRSELWNRVANKHGFVVEILIKNLSFEDSKELEVFLISLYGRRNLGTGSLVNMTDGGEGTCGLVLTSEQKERISIRQTGRIRLDMMGENNPNFGKKGSLNHNYGKKHSQKTRDKISKSNVGKVCLEKNKQLYKELYSGDKGINSKRVVDTFTGEEYGCLKDACKKLSLNYNTTRKRLTGILPSIDKTSLRYIIKDNNGEN